jgi:hypothetical protein
MNNYGKPTVNKDMLVSHLYLFTAVAPELLQHTALLLP